MLLACAVASAHAQVPRFGHRPSVGTGALNPTHATEFLARSTRFNSPDGVWNLGEGFKRATPGANPADTGGYLSKTRAEFDDGTTLEVTDIHPNPPFSSGASAWEPFTYVDTTAAGSLGPGNANLMRFVGYLHPSGGLDGYTAQSAFEIIMPAAFTTAPTVLVVAAWHTLGRGESGWYTGYPASRFVDPRNAGLRGYREGPPSNAAFDAVSRPFDLDRLAAFSGSAAADGFNIVTAYPVPADHGGHFTITAQRMLQLITAVDLMFDPAAPVKLHPAGVQNLPTGPLPVCAVGGSNGGFVAQFLATHFPDRVHGACWTQISFDMRDTAGYQASYRFLTALQGFGGSAGEWAGAYNFAYSTPFAQLGFTHGWATGSALRIWQAGLAHRPMYAIGGDEDTVWNGSEAIAQLSGTDWMPEGSRLIPPATSKVFWTIVDKACHENRGVYTIPNAVLAPPTGGSGGGHPMAGEQTELGLAVLPFLDEVVASSAIVLTPAARPTEANVISNLITGPELPFDQTSPYDSRLDQFGSVYARASTHVRRGSLGTPSLTLTEDPNFIQKSRGLGTGLGLTESLKIDAQGGVWVGSADGVVTRLIKDPSRPTSPTLIVDKRCRASAGDDPLHGPFSLGYGAWGLDVAHGYLAVGTFSRLMVYDLVSNATLAGPDFEIELPWSEQQPGYVRIVENFFGTGGKFVVYVSILGELVVRQITTGLPAVAHLSDPDCGNFEIGESVVAGWSKPLYLSTRGHIVQVVVDQSLNYTTNTPTVVEVRAASQLYSGVRDLTWGTSDGGARLAAYLLKPFSPHGSGIYEFDPSTSPIFDVTEIIDDQIAFLEQTGRHAADSASAGQIVSLGLGRYVLLERGRMLMQLNQYGAEKWGLKPETTDVMMFPAAHYPTAIAYGDVGQDGQEDVVVATESGQVAFIPVSYLETGDIALLTNQVLGNEFVASAGAPQPDLYSSGSVTATWGMTWGPTDQIELLDQCARRWSIEPTSGDVTFRNMVHDALGATQVVALKPFRDLVWLGEDPPDTLTQLAFPDVTSDLQIPAQGDYFRIASLFTTASAGTTPDDVPAPPSIVGKGPPAATWDTDRLHYQLYEHGYLPLCYSGDWIAPVAGRKEVYFWTGSNDSVFTCHDALRGVIYPENPSLADPHQFWSSTTKFSAVPPTQVQTHFRNPLTITTAHDCQALRVGRWGTTTADVRLVASAAGGSLMIANPRRMLTAAKGSIEYEPSQATGDCGFGGMALCVEQVLDTPNDHPTIFFAPVYAHGRSRTTGAFGGQQIVSSLHVYDYDSIGPSLEETDSHSLDAEGAFGVCGLAVADLTTEAADGVAKELIVTTLNGDLLVFNLAAGSNSTSVQIGSRLHHSVHDGALGANNAILAGHPPYDTAIYVSGSFGLRRFF